MMRNFAYILFAILFPLLNACSPSSSLTSEAEEANNDDVYFVKKTIDKESGSKGPSRMKSGQKVAKKKDRPDYYNPRVAEEMEWEQLQDRYDSFYYRGLYPERSMNRGVQSTRYWRHRTSSPERYGSQMGDNSSNGSSGGNNNDDDNSDSSSKSRDRSYDTDGNTRDR